MKKEDGIITYVLLAAGAYFMYSEPIIEQMRDIYPVFGAISILGGLIFAAIAIY